MYTVETFQMFMDHKIVAKFNNRFIGSIYEIEYHTLSPIISFRNNKRQYDYWYSNDIETIEVLDKRYRNNSLFKLVLQNA